ncbi:MAG: hypothetical protein K9N49_08105, partial [Candidatus Marinimicrobia bacterium]|nr:hypothetical protein [Candidatus Neomarinimicrobiota bacterium]
RRDVHVTGPLRVLARFRSRHTEPRLLVSVNYAGPFDLWTMRLDGTGRLRLTDGSLGLEPRAPRLSPAGDRILALAEDADLGGRGHARMFLWNAEGSAAREILADVPYKHPGAAAWMPDGERVVFAAYTESEGDQRTLFMAGIGQDGEAVDLTPLLPAPTRAGYPAVNAAGTAVAYADGAPGEPLRIHLLDLETQTTQLLAERAGLDLTSPAWATDGRTLAFSAQGGTSRHSLYHVRAEGTGLDLLTVGQDALLPTFTDSQRLAFISHGQHWMEASASHIGMANLDGSQQVAFSQGAGIWHHGVEYGWLPLPLDDREYILTYTADTGGWVDGESLQYVMHGAVGWAVTAVADAGHAFVQWSDGVATATRQDLDVMADLTVAAEFALNTYTLTYTAGPDGWIQGETVQTVAHGGNGAPVTAIPDAGYDFVQWSDGVATATRQDAAITGNLAVTAEFTASAAGPSPLLNGLVSFWSFEGDFRDRHGPNHGSPAAGVSAANQGSLVGTAPFFNGSSSAYVTCGNDASLNITGTAHSMAAWVYNQSPSKRSDIISKGRDYTSNYGYHMWWQNNTVVISYRLSNGHNNVLTHAGLAGDTWHHLAATFDGTTGRLYVNGALVASTVQAGSIGSASTAFTIGAHSAGPTGWGYQWHGKIDEVGIWNRVLGPAEVAALFQDGAGQAYSFPTVPMHEYALTYEAGPNGTLDGATPQTVAHGADGTPVTAVAEDRYRFVQWSDGRVDNPRTDRAVTGDVTVQAEFDAWWKAPDFVVQSVILEQEPSELGQTFTAYVKILNQGDIIGDAGVLRIWASRAGNASVGEPGEAQQAAGILEAGASRTFTFTGLTAPGSEGPHHFRAFVDAEDVTEEKSEGNNQLAVKYTVPLRASWMKPDFIITALTLEPVPSVTGTEFTLHATVRNQGDLPGDGGVLRAWASRTPNAAVGEAGDAEQAVGVLDAGASRSFTFDGLIAATRAGTHHARVLVDADGQTAEKSEGNNHKSVTYRVWDIRLTVTAQPEGMELRWNSRRGLSYRVLRADDLTSGFVVIAEGVAATQPENVYLDPVPPAGAASFYTVEVE